MDSMRSLNRSLPSTQSDRPAPPEQLLQAFKQAALSVTNLYKSAANGHESIRQAGYQDAIDELLKFLDQENLGVQDGEGWRIRQWATAKYDNSYIPQSENEEDEEPETHQANRGSGPEPPAGEEKRHGQLPEKESGAHQPVPQEPQQVTLQAQPPSVFQFCAGSDNDMQTDDSQASSSRETPPVCLEVINRHNRSAHRNSTRQPPRSISRTSPPKFSSKRKYPFPDISEIFNLTFDKKDGPDGSNGGGGGTKRSRLV